jgi:hypothetical protein
MGFLDRNFGTDVTRARLLSSATACLAPFSTTAVKDIVHLAPAFRHSLTNDLRGRLVDIRFGVRISGRLVDIRFGVRYVLTVVLRLGKGVAVVRFAELVRAVVARVAYRLLIVTGMHIGVVKPAILPEYGRALTTPCAWWAKETARIPELLDCAGAVWEGGLTAGNAEADVTFRRCGHDVIESHEVRITANMYRAGVGDHHELVRVWFIRVTKWQHTVV